MQSLPPAGDLGPPTDDESNVMWQNDEVIETRITRNIARLLAYKNQLYQDVDKAENRLECIEKLYDDWYIKVDKKIKEHKELEDKIASMRSALSVFLGNHNNTT